MLFTKEIGVAAAVLTKHFRCFRPWCSCIQSSLHAQPPKIDVSKVKSAEFLFNLIKRLRGTLGPCDAGPSKS